MPVKRLSLCSSGLFISVQFVYSHAVNKDAVKASQVLCSAVLVLNISKFSLLDLF